ncbi:MAG: glycoside hydrolase [Thermoguttaceae bacterium]|nr:glycoside hydrolase [Thermoguttaceae bacterium]MDW8037435.1 glycoside hydrolase [Thermoguttaceae bacterium]
MEPVLGNRVAHLTGQMIKTLQAAALGVGFGLGFLVMGTWTGWAAEPNRLPPTHVFEQAGKWHLENAYLKVSVDPKSGAWQVLDKRIRHIWPSAVEWNSPENRLQKISAEEKTGSLRWQMPLFWKENKPQWATVSLRLFSDRPELAIEVDMADRSIGMLNSRFWEPLLCTDPEGVIAVADYCNGHLYPVRHQNLPRRWNALHRLDMPWVGLCDLKTGRGYMVIFETSDDGDLELRKITYQGESVWAPMIWWHPSMGQFGYPRKLLYYFADRGGYVALAKRYRAYAASLGLIVPFAEKLKVNPELRRLFGAVDVWGGAGLKFAQEAYQAGIRRMILHGRFPPDQMRKINELGYLTSEYDNYTDVLPVGSEDKIDRSHDLVPQSVVLQANGQRMKAWLTFDRKVQYMKRCPALWVRTAKKDIPKILSTYPFLGRFIDVTTAEGLYECYDPAHRLTRGQKRQCGVELLNYVRSLKLAVGGEHGIWWAVPYVDYFEGMMSGGYYSWPAGHLIPPKTKEQSFDSPWGGKYGSWESYDTWGIGHRYRAPLWELVFHDCVVTTWYWGDSSDFLLEAAPEVTPKKDAFNILYGTIPLLWADRDKGSWHKNRDVFLRTYRNTCILHEVHAGTEMLSHEFVTPDRDVQKTTFSDGTLVIVNFGEKPYALQADGKQYLLPQNGFYVKGPKIQQRMELRDGKIITTIRTANYQHQEER